MSELSQFSKPTIDKLKYYVYTYSDPDTKKTFYVGKGKGNRVFNHLNADNKSEISKKINEILKKGKKPLIELLVHGIEDENTALKIEAAVIDILGIENLTNKQRGYNSSLYGKLDIDTVNARYNCIELKEEDITENIIMLKVNKFYYNGITPEKLYDITRGEWTVNIDKARNIKYALSVYEGIIVEVYNIVEWFPAYTTFNQRHIKQKFDVNSKKRYEFIGNIAEENIRKKYINKSVAHLFKNGGQNPIKYFIKE